MASDLDRQEKAITGILRPPLEQGRAVQDSAERAKDLKVQPGCGHGWTPWLSGALESWCSMGSLATSSENSRVVVGAVLGQETSGCLSPGAPPNTSQERADEARAASAWLAA